MTVVGHVEQMHASRCYRESRTLSCLTCHDPHGEPAAEDRTAYYDSVCLKCHKPEPCTVDPHRASGKARPTIACSATCRVRHTDIPHLAFTHHRIGIYDNPPAAHSLPCRRGWGRAGWAAWGDRRFGRSWSFRR